jgi:hypothetical protein
MAKISNKLLNQFLGDIILVFVSGFDQEMNTEEGPITVPMVCQGLLVDYDSNFILLGDEENGGFSLININNIGKIDTVNENAEEMVGRPDKGNMN